MADAAMNGREDAEMGGGAQQGAANSPPMCSMLEFTQQMMADAEDQKILVPIVARLIAKLVEENDKVGPPPLPADTEITVFHAQKSPAVNVMDYAERFIQQQRALQRDFRVNSLNVHRLMLSSVMVAAKFLDDFYYSNEFWAKAIVAWLPRVN
ncbi:hypothetical protein T484DRAFT_1773922 [Baffinella frigidus]|nr:hypothetical protein T484DRAFT_1773922 [Cryptophyta sp. CCMP2293]